MILLEVSTIALITVSAHESEYHHYYLLLAERVMLYSILHIIHELKLSDIFILFFFKFLFKFSKISQLSLHEHNLSLSFIKLFIYDIMLLVSGQGLQERQRVINSLTSLNTFFFMRLSEMLIINIRSELLLRVFHPNKFIAKVIIHTQLYNSHLDI